MKSETIRANTSAAVNAGELKVMSKPHGDIQTVGGGAFVDLVAWVDAETLRAWEDANGKANLAFGDELIRT